MSRRTVRESLYYYTLIDRPSPLVDFINIYGHEKSVKQVLNIFGLLYFLNFASFEVCEAFI